jgi:hypothetical protein
MPKAKQQNSYPLRMPVELRDRLEAVAEATGKSVNALIVEMLQDALDHPPGDLKAFSSPDLLHEVILRYGSLVKIEVKAESPPQKDD